MKTPEVVSDEVAQLGEGALWNPFNNTLLWIDIEGKKLHVFDPKSKLNQSIELNQRIGTVVPINETEVLVALKDGIYQLNTQTEALKKMADPEPDRTDNRFNDGKCDPNGRFWVGTMSMNGLDNQGALYCVYPDFSVEKKIDSVSISNGIVWSLDKTKMYYIDTPTRKVVEYQYDNATGAISAPRDAIVIPDSLGFPDGSTLDVEGMLWIAMWNGHSLTRWNPQTGELLQRLEVPALNVTSCAFGGENLDVLYITTAFLGMDEDQQAQYPLAGQLFAVKPGVKGVSANFFK
jgi:sugar lactone lactonase YvrE